MFFIFRKVNLDCDELIFILFPKALSVLIEERIFWCHIFVLLNLLLYFELDFPLIKIKLESFISFIIPSLSHYPIGCFHFQLFEFFIQVILNDFTIILQFTSFSYRATYAFSLRFLQIWAINHGSICSLLLIFIHGLWVEAIDLFPFVGVML